MLFALGAMSAYHVRRGWELRRNRVSGSVVIALFTLLIATGYVLYYLVNDDTHALVSLLHWGVGLALAPTLIAHIVAGRRDRRIAPPVGPLDPRQRRLIRRGTG